MSPTSYQTAPPRISKSGIIAHKHAHAIAPEGASKARAGAFQDTLSRKVCLQSMRSKNPVTGVPVIDIPTLDASTLAQIDAACIEWGFFHVTGHGVARTVRDNTLARMREFFALPRPQKLAVERTATNSWGFYDRELTKNTPDWKEIFDIGPPETSGPMAGASPQWPDEPVAFRPAMEIFAREAKRVAYRVLEAISINLGLPPDALRVFFSDHTSFLRLNYYPVCDDPAPPDSPTVPKGGHLAIGHHTDAGAVTVLLQDDQTGLQVLHDGAWSNLTPVPGTLTINIGDVVQVWSNDRYPAPLHRVTAHAGRERFSAPFFFNPAYATDFAPMVGRPRYRTINWGEYRAARSAGDYADFGEEIQISHFRLHA